MPTRTSGPCGESINFKILDIFGAPREEHSSRRLGAIRGYRPKGRGQASAMQSPGRSVPRFSERCQGTCAAKIIPPLYPDGQVWLISDGDPAGERFAQPVLTKVTPHCSALWGEVREREAANGPNRRKTEFMPHNMRRTRSERVAFCSRIPRPVRFFGGIPKPLIQNRRTILSAIQSLHVRIHHQKVFAAVMPECQA